MDTRAIPTAFFEFIREAEGCQDHVYADVGGKLTAGYGHLTIGMKVGDPCSRAMIDGWLKADAMRAADLLEQQIGAEVRGALTENQYAALISFVFNVGANPKWTIWKRLRCRQFDQVPLELMKFVNATVGGEMVKVKGLVNRRAAEVALWSTGEPGSVDAELPSSATRTAETPPTPADPVSAGKSKGLIAGAVAAIAAVPQAVDSVTHVVAPYAKHSEHIEQWVAGAFTLAGVCAAISWGYMWLQKRNARN